jgi:hypothetical protein
MNLNPLKILSAIIFILIGGLVRPSPVRGDAVTDIQVFLENVKLMTGLPKYVGTFDPVTFETHDPGFAGSLPLGHQYGIQISQKLWYHSGIEGDPVTPVPTGAFVRVADANMSLDVTGSSGLQTGLILDENLSESLHGHLDFLLFPNSGATAPAGVYGLVLQITSPSYQTSDPFLLAIANIAGSDLSREGIEYGEQAIFNVAVPEPSSIALAGLGVAGLAGAALRRRMRKQ